MTTTTTVLATAFGVAIGCAFTYVMYTTVPAYHDALVWSWGLMDINLEAIFN